MPPKFAHNQADPDHHLYQRGGCWYIRYELGGVEQRKSLGTADVKKARKERDRILKGVDDRREGKAPAPDPVIHSWQDAVDGCLAHLEAQARAGEISTAAVRRYEVSWVQITAGLEWEVDEKTGKPKPIPLETISKATITDYVEDRREEERSTSTIVNDMTAWNHVMAYASNKGWIEDNPVRSIERLKLVGQRRTSVSPPTDPQVAELIEEVAEWSQDMASLTRWLRETGMRLAEALILRRSDIHPCGTKATLRLGVKRNRGDGGSMTRTIDLGRAADMLAEIPEKGRLFARLPTDSAIVSARYGQWRPKRQARENRAAKAAGREPSVFDTFRLHALRHAFAVASLVDDDTCIYRLSAHLGHTLVTTTEIYAGHIRRHVALQPRQDTVRFALARAGRGRQGGLTWHMGIGSAQHTRNRYS